MQKGVCTELVSKNLTIFDKLVVDDSCKSNASLQSEDHTRFCMNDTKYTT